MEIWIATGCKKELKKEHPFLRLFAVIDLKEISDGLGYESSEDLDEHCTFILNSEVRKKIIALNSSKRFYRVLYIVENLREELAHDLLEFAKKNELKYECVYMKLDKDFELICKSY